MTEIEKYITIESIKDLVRSSNEKQDAAFELQEALNKEAGRRLVSIKIVTGKMEVEVFDE